MTSTKTLINDLDHALAEILSCELARPVQCVAGQKPLGLEAEQSLPAVVSTVRDLGAGRCQVVIELPRGSQAVCECRNVESEQVRNHARAVIQLEASRNYNEQMQSEVDALTAQVLNDFEEISLIRSLAGSMELNEMAHSVSDLVLRSLLPLAEGVGTEAIAWVGADDEQQSLGEPIWSGEAVVNQPTLFKLVEEYREEAESHPVVRNNFASQPKRQAIDAGNLKELVLVQCRSEGRMHGWLIACNRRDESTTHVPWAQLGFTTVQASLMETATNQLAAQLHNARLLKQKEELFTDVVCALVNAVEARDPYTCGHSERVARFARQLATLRGESQAHCEHIYLTGLLHDVGKIAIPDDVLQKPGKLDRAERAIIETHTDAGWRILHELEALRDVLPGVLYHHEHFDGNGYPDGLVGEEIPLDGRILAVCDAFDAMTSDRPYRKGMPTAQATDILQEGRGRYWDPQLVDLFASNVSDFDEIRVNHTPRQPANRRVVPSTGKSD
ncbi:MAG: HD-GYP domain-containing protein [Planctomycetota bacterium]